MNQSMAVAYATLGKEFLALILKVVMVRTVVTPEERKVKSQLQLEDTGSVLGEGHQLPSERKFFISLSKGPQVVLSMEQHAVHFGNKLLLFLCFK
jgi:hypothetical protein